MGSPVGDWIATVKQSFGIGIKGKRATIDANALTANRTLALQDAAGTIALTAMSATQRVRGRNSAGAGDQEEVTLSQLLDWVGSAANGDILYRGASSWSRLAAGTAGQVLQTNGAAAPTWVTPAMTLLATATASSSATVDFTWAAGQTYQEYLIIFSNLLPATSATSLWALTSADGTTWDTGAADYGWAMNQYNTASYDNSDSKIFMAGSTIQWSNAANREASGEVRLFDVGASKYGKMTWLMNTMTDSFCRHEIGAGTRLSAAPVRGIRFKFSSGNIATGDFRLYGIAR